MPTPTPEQAYAALQAGGLSVADPDIVRMLDITQPDYVERARAAKPYLFGEAPKPGTETGNTSSTAKKPAANGGKDTFDARTAKPEEVKARLAELTRSTRRPALERRDGMMRDARTLADLRAGR